MDLIDLVVCCLVVVLGIIVILQGYAIDKAHRRIDSALFHCANLARLTQDLAHEVLLLNAAPTSTAPKSPTPTASPQAARKSASAKKPKG